MNNIFKIILTVTLLTLGMSNSFAEEATATGEVSENNVDCSKINGSTTSNDSSGDSDSASKPQEDTAAPK